MYRQAAETARPVARLRGLSDLSGETLRRRDEMQRRFFTLLMSYGYHRLDTPLLEPTELFLRKSGGELASQLFSFSDPAGRAVSLRPEFTAPAIRHYLDNSENIELPVRWQYSGPVFRFDGAAMQEDGPYRTQFTQAGGELLGADGVLADAELLSLSIAALSEAGLDGWTLRLSDLGVLNSLLDSLEISERARAFVVQSVPRMSEGQSVVPALVEESRRLHVIGRSFEDDYLSQAVQGLSDDEARNVLLGVLRSNPLDQLGQRKPDEVVERLLRKIRRSDVEENLRRALEVACELAQIRGDAATAIAGASSVLSSAGADISAASRLEQILEMLPRGQGALGEIVLDFGLVRGLAYYNGIVFEVSHPGWPGPLGGGGRYDGLARDLGGGQRLPALGFAYNLDALAELANTDTSATIGVHQGVLVVPAEPGAQPAALKAALDLRNQGELAEVEVSGRAPEDARDFATRLGFARTVVVESDGTQRDL